MVETRRTKSVLIGTRIILLGLILTTAPLDSAVASIKSGRQVKLLAVSFTGDLAELSMSTGAATFLGNVGHHVNAAAADAQGNVYVLGGRDLLLVDPFSAEVRRTTALVGIPSGYSGTGLAFDWQNQAYTILSRSGEQDLLARVNTTNGGVSVVGATGFNGLQGLSAALDNDELWAVDVYYGLVALDKGTGIGTIVSRIDVGADDQALELAPDGTLLAARNQLVKINLETMEVTPLGPTKLNDVRGLALLAIDEVSCNVDADCPVQLMCVSGRCIRALLCDDDADCTDDDDCTSDTCVDGICRNHAIFGCGSGLLQSNPRRLTIDLGLQPALDAEGQPQLVQEQEVSKLICPISYTDSDGVQHRLGDGHVPLDPGVLDDRDEDGEPSFEVVVGAAARSAAGLRIVLDIRGTPPSGAVDAIVRACERYICIFDNNVTLRIKIKFKNLDDDILGSHHGKQNKYKYRDVRSALISSRDGDDSLLFSLPSGDRIDVKYKDNNIHEEKHVYLIRTTAKAIGLLSSSSTKNDATLKFNTSIRWDYDPTDGIRAKQIDFEAVIVHELGHLLGFSSGVDDRHKNIENIDLFRFFRFDCAQTQNEFANEPRTGGKKKQDVACRSCLPGWGDWRMSTGENGDGNQASHWKADELTGVYVGIMDPTLAAGAETYSPFKLLKYFTDADVRALDAIGWDFDPPSGSGINLLGNFSLLAPSDRQTSVSLTPTFQWQPSTNADKYHLWIRDNSTHAIIFSTTTSNTSYAVPSGVLVRDRTYTWSVYSENCSGTRVSDFWSFTTWYLHGPIPGDFDLVEPSNNGVVASREPYLAWTAADLSVASYTIEIDDDPNFADPLVHRQAGIVPAGGYGAYEVPPRLLENDKRYYWRVEAVNGAGKSWCYPETGYSFVTGNAPPAEFGLLLPADETSVSRMRPTLVWQDSIEVEAYTVVVDDDPSLESPEIVADGILETQYRLPAGSLRSGTTYYWMVTAVNAAGETPSQPGIWSFTTEDADPEPFLLAYPADNADLLPLTPTLRWTESNGAIGYIVEIADDPEFDAPLLYRTTATPGFAVPPGVLDRGGRYFWRVTAYNFSGYTEAVPVVRALAVSAGHADCDSNGIVDMMDIACYQICYSGAIRFALPECAIFDIEPDGDVDLADLAVITSGMADPR